MERDLLTNPIEEERPLRVLLVDDHAFFRAGLRTMLVDAGLAVTEARSGPAAIEVVTGDRPDVVLMDLNMPHMSGTEATRVIVEKAAVPVVMLTMSAEDEDVVEAVRAGARGYVLKDAPLDEIVRSARAAAAGEAWISPRVTGPLLERVVAVGDAPPAVAPAVDLSDREREVLRLVAAGKDNAAIARELYLGAGTVRKYVSSILVKLGVANRVEAAVYAVRHGLA